jgi:hypothetical protein
LHAKISPSSLCTRMTRLSGSGGCDRKDAFGDQMKTLDWTSRSALREARWVKAS